MAHLDRLHVAHLCRLGRDARGGNGDQLTFLMMSASHRGRTEADDQAEAEGGEAEGIGDGSCARTYPDSRALLDPSGGVKAIPIAACFGAAGHAHRSCVIVPS